MAATANDRDLLPVRAISTDGLSPIIMWCRALIGSSGAITSYEGSNGVTPTDGGTAIVEVAFPACQRAIVFAQVEFTGDSMEDAEAQVGAIER